MQDTWNILYNVEQCVRCPSRLEQSEFHLPKQGHSGYRNQGELGRNFRPGVPCQGLTEAYTRSSSLTNDESRGRMNLEEWVESSVTILGSLETCRKDRSFGTRRRSDSPCQLLPESCRGPV